MIRSFALFVAVLCVVPLATPPVAQGGGRDPRPVPKDTQVTLIEAGGAPRRPLRYRFKAGDTVEMTMDMTMAMGIEFGGKVVPPQAMPTMRMVFEFAVRRVSPAGESTLAFLLKEVSLVGTSGFTPEQQKQILAVIGTVKGFQGTVVVTSRGVTKSVTYKTPPGMSPQAKQLIGNLSNQMKQLSTPFPVEPVGVGARWRVVIPIQGPPITLASQLEFQLVARGAAGPRLKVKISGWAPPQAMQLPELQGMSARLKSLSVTGSGEMELSLSRPASTATLTAKQSMESVFDVAGQPQSMKMNMDMKVGIRSR